MSSNTPPGPHDASGPHDGAARPAAGSPEYLGMGAPVDADPSGQPRRWPVLGGVAVGVAAVVGLGGWGAFALLSGGGAQPAEVIPADAVAYLSLDLDPSASQKVEAFEILKKFPGLREELGLDTTDDLRRLVFEKIQDEGECTDLDYDSDIKPWIGERLALAAVPDDKPGADAPVVALQVGDRDAAERGIRALADCGGAGDDFGFAFTGDYVLVTDSQQRAAAIAAGVEDGSLADDPAFQDWTGKVGDPGILTMYAAPGAPGYFADLQHDASQGWGGYGPQAGLMAESDHNRAAETTRSLYEDFKGMAVTVRFDDGAVEAEFAGEGLPAGLSSSDGTTGPGLADLPASTGAAFSVGLPDGWLDGWLDSMNGFLGAGGSTEEMLAQAEAETGLTLPEDIETLFGDGVSLSFDADTDLDAVFEAQDPTRLPVGLRVKGNPDAILPIVEKLRAAIGPEADMVLAEAGDGMVAFGLNPDYLETLLAGGALGDEDSFRDAVPDAERATGALYVNFDAGDGWAEHLAELLSDSDGTASPAGENIAPLDALGVSTWVDGDDQRVLFRMTSD